MLLSFKWTNHISAKNNVYLTCFALGGKNKAPDLTNSNLTDDSDLSVPFMRSQTLSEARFRTKKKKEGKENGSSVK